MAKLSLDRIKQKYGWHGHNYKVLMSAIIADNAQRIHNSILQIDHAHLREGNRKLRATDQAINLPKLTDVLKPQGIWAKKGAEKSKLITDTLKDRIGRDIKEILGKPEYQRKKGKLAGTLKDQAIRDMGDRVRQTFENYTRTDPSIGVPKNIKAIASTEVRAVINQTKQEFMQKLLKENDDIVMIKKWIHNGNVWGSKSYAPRRWHARLHNTEKPFNENFKIRDEQTAEVYSVPYPHHETLPPGQVINCVTGKTKINPCDIQKIYRRIYHGDILKIKTKSGLNVQVTPNHPIFTPFGFIPARFLKVGGDIVGVRMCDAMSGWNPDIKNIPSSIGKMFDFFSIIFGTCRSFGSNADFHGDGKTGNVDIISIDSKLLCAFQSSFHKPFGHFVFHCSYKIKRILSCYSSIIQFFIRWFSSTIRNIGIFSKNFFFFVGKIIHSGKCGITIASDIDTSFNESGSYSASIDFENLSKSIFGGSTLVSLDEIVNVEKYFFHGYVYNLQTDDSVYTTPSHNYKGKSIIFHNCNCEIQYIARKE
jgi:hypothetical protein